MKLNKLAYAIAILGTGNVFVVPSALATFGLGDSAAYVGASIGQARYKDTPGVRTNGDKKDTGYKVFTGFQLNPVVGLEGTYYDLGKYSGNSTAFNGSTVVPTSVSGDATAWGVAAIITAPTNLFSVFGTGFGLFGKVGMVKSRLTNDVSGIGFNSHRKESNIGSNFGVGAKFDFAKNYSIRTEYERLNNVGDKSTTGETRIDFWSVGLAYKF